MSSAEIIIVRNLKKVFNIYDNPADRVKELFSFTRKKYSFQYTALRDISFSINEGEFVGIVGRNGAGKSTLLKILSGRLTATEGSVSVKGSISLLQLGIGFNKELTGQENIRFSTRLLGHARDKVDQIVDEVTRFADIGEFIHHPVKTYSSGMYSRLSFAIGITIDPDILIVDEVLSVGDMQFAAKCLARLHELKQKGKTVIIVTHDIDKIFVFCDRAIWIKDSRIEEIGTAKDVVQHYRDYMLMGDNKTVPVLKPQTEKLRPLIEQASPPGNMPLSDIEWINLSRYESIQHSDVRITHAALYNKKTASRANTFSRGDTILLFLKIQSEVDIDELVVGWVLIDKRGLIAVHSGSNFCGNNIKTLKRDKEARCCFEVTIPPLKDNEYIFSLGIRIEDSVVYKVNNIFPISISTNNDNSRQGGYVIVEESSFIYEQ
jgi:ABC-type polysaccharide/polyol phosphate transport system ATPase subunit